SSILIQGPPNLGRALDSIGGVRFRFPREPQVIGSGKESLRTLFAMLVPSANSSVGSRFVGPIHNGIERNSIVQVLHTRPPIIRSTFNLEGHSHVVDAADKSAERLPKLVTWVNSSEHKR